VLVQKVKKYRNFFQGRLTYAINAEIHAKKTAQRNETMVMVVIYPSRDVYWSIHLEKLSTNHLEKLSIFSFFLPSHSFFFLFIPFSSFLIPLFSVLFLFFSHLYNLKTL